MTRRELLASIVALAAARLARSARAAAEPGEDPMESDTIERIEVPPSEWKPLLSPEAYAVLFEEATEPPFSSPLNDEKRAGTYLCAACHLPLFDAKAKFDSGTGWPSFFEALPGRVGTRRDFRLLLPRTEYHCIRCNGHQGHVFRDGPPPTGLRYCNNGLALRFVPEGSDRPPLRRPPA